MNIHYYILFTLTFFTGAVAGAVLYVGAFAPAFQPPPPTQIGERNFELRGERFDRDCIQNATNCARLTLTEDRRLQRTEVGGGEVPSVRVSSAYFRELQAETQAAPLAAIQGESVECMSFDEAGSEYLLIYQGEPYNIHTCSDTYVQSALFPLLEQLWGDSVPTTATPVPVLEEGIGGFLQRYLKEQFDTSSEQ